MDEINHFSIKENGTVDSSVFAKLYKRILAFIIDVIIIYFTSICFTIPLSVNIENPRIWGLIFGIFFSVSYFTFFFLKVKGQTIGAKFFGIKVISSHGYFFKFRYALVRAGLVTILVFPFFSFNIILALSYLIFSLYTLKASPTKERKQTIWDLATKTCVVEGGVKLKWRVNVEKRGGLK